MNASMLILCLLAISTSASPTDRTSERAQQLAEATNNVAVDILKVLPKDENMFFSPLSLVTALGMLYAGARGSTSREMREVLSFDRTNLQDSDVHPAFQEILNQLISPSTNYTLHVANKALIKTGFSVREEYKNILQTYYQAEIEEADFRTEGRVVMQRVNQWVNEQTRGMIPKLFGSPLPRDIALLLLNAVYFKGKWLNQFSEKRTQPIIFYNAGSDLNAKKVPTMQLKTKAMYGYSTDWDSKLLELPYVGDDLSMVFILPDARNGLGELENKLTNEKLQEVILSTLRFLTVDIRIPKFKLEKEYNLNDILEAIGLFEVFSNYADLSGIVKDGGLSVDEVIQKTVVEVNEEGSKAAAVTAIRTLVRSRPRRPEIPPPTFYADHPFLFAIRDRKTNLFLFLGRVNEL